MPHLDTAPLREVAPTPSAARAMLDTLRQRGVDVAFGIPGGLISPIFDALSDAHIRWIPSRHESMAGFAGMGHAIATGRPALVLTTGGPGLTNVITAVAAAFVEELPMVVLAGDVPTTSTSRGALHDTSIGGIDGLALMRTVTRYSARVESPDAAVGAVEQAMRLVMGPRPGPVFLSVPLDVGVAASHGPRLAPPSTPPPLTPDPAACSEIARTLITAKRPLLVVGNGARGAAPQVFELAERLGCPVVTTPHAKGIFPDSHRLHLGGIGFGGHPSATEYLQSRPDVVLVIGSRLGDYATNGWTLPICGTRATFQIDREAWLIGRNYPVTCGVVADARLALTEIIAALPSDLARPLRPVLSRRLNRPQSVTSDAVPLAPGRIMRALETAFPNAFYAVDQGENGAIALHYLTIDDPGSFSTMVGLASMGSGFGVGIGYRAARQDRPAIAIIGDGTFAMHAGEVLSLVDAGLDLVIVVMNDGRWGMVDKGFASVFGRQPTGLPSRIADLAGVATEFGAVGLRIETPRDLAPERLRAAANRGRPLVIDARFDTSEALSVSTRSAALRRAVGG